MTNPHREFTVEVVVATHRGLVREHNEDAIGLDGWTFQADKPPASPIRLPSGAMHLIAVCDGMGGHLGGARASRLSAGQITELSAEQGQFDAREFLTARIRSSADMLNEISRSDVAMRGLGSTAVVAAIDDRSTVTVGNIGDSRAYRLEDGYLAQLTVDHRVENTNRLTQALGAGLNLALRPDFYTCSLSDGMIVLCSDGISDYVSDAAVEETLRNAGAPTGVAESLVAQALAGGGGDNATAVTIALQPPTPHESEHR